jgi:two-component system cell cycle response regulator
MAKSRVANPFEDTARTSPAPGPQPGEGNAAYLVVLAGSNVGEMYKVEERTVMGRSENADIRLFDEGISREHAQVVQEPAPEGAGADTQKFFLEDLGSTNGTFCNGTRVTRQPLADGDKILLGSTTILKFSYQDKLDEMFQRQMSESALRDGLTKAFNKRYFTERLESEYLYAVRHETPLALMFLDIDHFKRINDVHGHPAGDAVLVELAKLAQGALRNEDIFSRYGGEEFAVISRGTAASEAEALAERLRSAVEGHAFSFEGKPIAVTISVGIARAPREGTGSPGEFVALADEAMYTAKRAGRNRVCCARESPTNPRSDGS